MWGGAGVTEKKRKYDKKEEFKVSTLNIQSRLPTCTLQKMNSQGALKPVRSMKLVNPLNANPTKWPNTLKQFKQSKLPTNCLSVFDHFVKLGFKGLTYTSLMEECL